MMFDKCFPRELEYVRKNNIPVVIAGGTVEYHGPHCSYGCDTLVAEGLIKKLAEKKEIMIAPSISYSPSSYAVADEKSGTVHVEEDAFENYLYYVFMSMLCSKLRNIYVVIHHQFEQESLMPMTLSYMKAAKRATMKYLEKAATKPAGYIYGEDFENVRNPFVLNYGKETGSVGADAANKVFMLKGNNQSTDVTQYRKNVSFDLSKPVTFSGRMRVDREGAEYWALHIVAKPLNGGNVNLVQMFNDGLNAGGNYLGTVPWGSGWNYFSIKMTRNGENTVNCVLTINNMVYNEYSVSNENIGTGSFSGFEIWHQEFGAETNCICLDDIKLASVSDEGLILNRAVLTDKNGAGISDRSGISDSIYVKFNLSNYGEPCKLTPVFAVYKDGRLEKVSLNYGCILATGAESGNVVLGIDELPAIEPSEKLDVKLFYWQLDSITPLLKESSWSFPGNDTLSLYVDGNTEGGDGSYNSPFFQ